MATTLSKHDFNYSTLPIYRDATLKKTLPQANAARQVLKQKIKARGITGLGSGQSINKSNPKTLLKALARHPDYVKLMISD